MLISVCFQAFKAMNGDVSCSSMSDDEITSELGDPIHDDSILQALFYKNPVCTPAIYISIHNLVQYILHIYWRQTFYLSSSLLTWFI